jgi:NAD(P)H dehydrogenase (quinone)
MTASALVVTGATGRIGGLVAASLTDAGVDVRLLVRDPARVPEHLRGLHTSVADYSDTAAVREALTGARTVLMVSAAESADRLAVHRGFVDAAAEAGVQHVVYTSFAGAAPDATFTLVRDHHATEEHLRASGMTWTFLRDNLYLDVLPLFAGEEGVLRGPAGAGRVAAVAQADVAAVATAVLTDLGPHAGATYELTGPEALTLDQAAATIAAVTGRDVRYEDETLDEAYASRAHHGVEPWQLDAWVSTYTAIAAGELERVTDDVERLTGRPPLSLEQLLRG